MRNVYQSKLADSNSMSTVTNGNGIERSARFVQAICARSSFSLEPLPRSRSKISA